MMRVDFTVKLMESWVEVVDLYKDIQKAKARFMD
jgi:hypothetical protein